MKEFIDKLISRLEEKFKYNSEQAEIYRDGSDTDAYFREKKDLYLDRANTYGEIRRIVNQLAEEYNNGWISVDVELPIENGKYLVYYHKWSDGNYLPKFNETEIRILRYRNNDWIFPTYGDTEAEKDSHREVIAWQPLPQPFVRKDD